MAHYQIEAPPPTFAGGPPERQLLASVLGRALMDLCAWDVQERAAALEWLNDDVDCTFSFVWITRQLGLSECIPLIREKAEQEFTQSMEYYEGQLQAERRPRRTRIFDLS